MIPVAAHCGFYFNSSWKLEPATLKFILKGNLPLPNVKIFLLLEILPFFLMAQLIF